MGARGSRSNQREVTTTRSLQKNQLKRNNILRKIKVEGDVDKGRDAIVCYKTATLKKWKGFESSWRYGLKFTDGFDEPGTPKPTLANPTMIAMNLITLIRNDLKIPMEEG